MHTEIGDYTVSDDFKADIAGMIERGEVHRLKMCFPDLEIEVMRKLINHQLDWDFKNSNLTVFNFPEDLGYE